MKNESEEEKNSFTVGRLQPSWVGMALPVHVHHVPVCVCTAAWHGPHYLPVQPVGVSGSRTRGPLHKHIHHTGKSRHIKSTQIDKQQLLQIYFSYWKLVLRINLFNSCLFSKNVFYVLFPHLLLFNFFII